jgi:hypothetical protein
MKRYPAPDVGVCEDVAQFYFKQLANGMVGAFTMPGCHCSALTTGYVNIGIYT